MQSNKLSKKQSIRCACPERGSKYIAQGKFQGNVALGGSGVVGTPCKGKSKIRIYSVDYRTFAPSGRIIRVYFSPGCRLTSFVLPWAMHLLGFQPVAPL
jgi:hypothetical protein